MIGERKNTFSDINYGTLVMRPYNIDGNEINAFYDAQNNLVFVLDNTISAQKPNVLLVINPDGDKKWDEILSGEYGVDLETIRPKVDNKYQKLDIEYSGLLVYETLINAYNAGDGLEEYLNQLAVLRDSAARHSAMTRLNIANETISKTNATIVKTKESIVRLETRIKTLRSKLSATKKEIGKVNTKQSASKILKLESQIEATNEKLKRAKKRLESAQKRLEIATVDAELASELLNQPSSEIKEIEKSKPVVVVPDYPVQTIPADDDKDEEEPEEEDFETHEEIKPLFAEDPQILNEDIAFKPIAFDAPVFSEEIEEKPEFIAPVSMPELPESENKPVLESIMPIEPVLDPVVEERAEITEEKPVLETIKPIQETPKYIEEPVMPVSPIAETVPEVPAEMPVAPLTTDFDTPQETKHERSKPGFVYYILLFILILLSVFTLWLYQRNMSGDAKPVLTAKTQETTVVEPKKESKPAPVAEEKEVEEEPVFFDEEPSDEDVVNVETKKTEETIVEEPKEEPSVIEEESITETNSEIIEEETPAPVVMDAVSPIVNTSISDSEEETSFLSEEDIIATKPVYEPGAKHDDMFIGADDLENSDDTDSYFDDEDIVYEDEIDY